jgi:hypothetical protein
MFIRRVNQSDYLIYRKGGQKMGFKDLIVTVTGFVCVGITCKISEQHKRE